MPRCNLFLIVSFILCAAASQAAEPPVAAPRKIDALDLIPADVVGAIAIRNVAELTKRGDALIDKAELKAPMRLSEGYGFVVRFLGVQRGLDDEGAAALMAFKAEFSEDALVMTVPVGDVAAMAENFKLTKEELATGKVIDRNQREKDTAPAIVRYIALHKDHLYMGGNPKIIESATTAKTLRAALAESDRASLAADDILFYANRRQMGALWNDFISGLDSELKKLAAEESQALRKIAAAADDLQSLVAGLRLEEGVGMTFVLEFAGEKSREILTQLQGSKTPATLAGLPRGRVLAAHASSGDGDASAALVRSLLLTKLPLDEQAFLSAAHRPNIVGVFGEVWQRLEGSRTALYENEAPDRHGQFSFVAILATDDAERFVTDVTSLAHFVNAATLTPDEAGIAIDANTIAALIKDLGADEYRTRQLASTKLGLIGAPALPAIKKATASNDPEVRFRTLALQVQIESLLAQQRDDLLKEDLLMRIKPKFSYFPKQETRSDRPVAIIQMQLRGEDEVYAAQLRRFLGPDWSKLRLATVGKQVVVLLGSDTTLLDQAIANVKSDVAGLQADERFAQFHARVPAVRTADFHLRLARSIEHTAIDLAGKPSTEAGTGTTSLGIAITPQRLRLDLFAPVSEVKSAASLFNSNF